jgi:hypothetical protein
MSMASNAKRMVSFTDLGCISHINKLMDKLVRVVFEKTDRVALQCRLVPVRQDSRIRGIFGQVVAEPHALVGMAP